MTTAKLTSVLSPIPPPRQSQQLPGLKPLATLAGKGIGFLSTQWPNYGPLVEELELFLRARHAVRGTPRLDYWRRPPLKAVWNEGREWLASIDAAVAGVGA